MKKSEYINLSSKELRALINKKKNELNILEDYIEEVKQKEHEKKYEMIKVNGCKGCELEHADYNWCCDKCEGWHFEDKLRKDN